MCSHEKKNCPRCGKEFECKPACIAQCQCYGIVISAEMKTFMEQRYTDCLCRDCLQHLQSAPNLFKEKHLINYP